MLVRVGGSSIGGVLRTTDMINISIRDAIRVKPRESSFVLDIVSLLIAIQPCLVSTAKFLSSTAMPSLENIAILVTQVSPTDRSVRVERLVTIGNHHVAFNAGHLASSGQMQDVDLANQVEGGSG